MKQLTINGNQDTVIEMILEGEHFKLSGSELLDAIKLYENTKAEIEEDEINLLLPNEQGKVRAVLYTSMEATELKRVKYPLYKDSFFPIDYKTALHEQHSPAFGHKFTSEVMFMFGGIPVFSLIFSDGSRYDHGKRKNFTDDYLTQEDLAFLMDGVKNRENG